MANYTPLHSYSENNMLHVSQVASVSRVFIRLFFPDTDVIMTLLQYFVCCINHSFQL